MVQEVGIAYVTVAPSAKGFGRAVEGEIDAGVAGASKSAGGRLKSLATSVVKWGTAAVVGVGAAITGLALKGGISRALNIEDAQAKLKGLGHDTQAIEAIMTDALASVRGTAFGLDTAATVAATAVAAGIKPGQELEKYLRLTADAATIAGVSMEEMGSILNKATTAGKVYTQELNQLADRGLPIFQWLQDEYQVTAEELRKMVADGKVDAETFRKVIEDNIGGAALSAGDTTRGAFANMRAAMSRFGEALVGPEGLGFVKTFFNEVTIIFDGLTERVKPFVESFQERFGDALNPEGMGDRFLNWFDRLVTAIESGPISQLMGALMPILPVLGEAAELLGGALGDAARELGEALAPVVPMLADLITESIVELAPALTDLLVALIPLLPTIIELLADLVPLLVDGLELVVPILKGVVDFFTGMIDGLWSRGEFFTGEIGADEFLKDMQAIEGPLKAIIDWAFEVGDKVAGVTVWLLDLFIGIKNFFTGIGDFFNDIAQNVHDFTRGVMDDFGSMFGWIGDALGAFFDWWGQVWASISGIFAAVWEIGTEAVVEVWAGFIDWLTSVTEPIATWWNGVWESISNFFTYAWNTISGIATSVWSSITGFFTTSFNALSGWWAGIWSGISDTFQNIWGSIAGFFTGIVNGILSTAQGFVNSFIDIINGITSGINDIAGAVGAPTISAIPKVAFPQLAEGGLVQARPGGILANIGEGRYDELVLPLSPEILSQIGGGNTVNQHNEIHMYDRDERVLLRRLGREIEGALAWGM